MSSADGVDKAPKLPADLRINPARSQELKKFPKTAEDYVMIENRLAAQREKPTPGPQFDSIFNQLRGRLPKQ